MSVLSPSGIEWTTICDDNGKLVKRGFSWSPLGWGCTARCGATAEKPGGWCYAYSIAQRFGDSVCDQYPDPNDPAHAGLDPKHTLCRNFFPHLHPERLEITRRKPAGIFVQPNGDMWDPNVPQNWRDQVYDVIYDAGEHTFWALSKQPQTIGRYEAEQMDELDNLWVGVSVTRHDETWRIRELIERVPGRRFASFEPLLTPHGYLPAELMEALDWVIIGAQTGAGAIRPEPEWVREIMDRASACGVPVYLKDNLRDDKGGPMSWTEVLYRRKHPAAMRGRQQGQAHGGGDGDQTG